MTEEILSNIENATELEKLYRLNPLKFSKSFSEIFDSVRNIPLAEFWNIRLKFDFLAEQGTVAANIAVEEIKNQDSYKKFNLIYTILASLLAGTIVKIPDMLNIENENYITDNIAFFVFPLLMVYYFIKNKFNVKSIVIFAAIVTCTVIFMNLIPGDYKNQTHVLSSIHATLFMWLLLGISFIGSDYALPEKRLQYLKRNGDVAILTSVILFAGMLLSALTMGLFSVIKVNIEKFYSEYIVIYGLLAAPFVANYMIENSPAIINKVAPFISKIFTPLILITMTSFLVALIFFAKDPFNNRNELIVFNVLLIVNLAIIVFSFAGQTTGVRSYYNKIILGLCAEAIIINCIAVSAIVYRLYIFGVTPNRIAVLGGNILMFINLALITLELFKYTRNKTSIVELNKSMTVMMPLYAFWVFFITFIFPFIFWFE